MAVRQFLSLDPERRDGVAARVDREEQPGPVVVVE